MNSYKKLMDNSIIFAVGTIGSKLIQFLLVPLYTYFLSSKQLGTADLVTVTISMLTPVISASIFESTLRFIMDDKDQSNVVLTNSITIAIIGCISSLFIYPLFIRFSLIEENLLIFSYLLLFTQIFQRILTQYTRAIGELKIFAYNGILLTLTIGILNVVFFTVFDLGLQGYFVAIILANIVSCIYLIVTTDAFKKISISLISKKRMQTLIVYAIPLIPNSLMWWLINTSSRYFVSYFVSLSANGLFAVASKIPSLVAIFNQVFQQAWQISAIEEFKEENKSQFYSNVFNYFSSFLFIGVSFVVIFVKIMFQYLFSAEYYEAWAVVPFLLLGSVFSAFSGFLGMNYIASKNTKGVLKTSLMGGFISLFFNFIFIPTLGIVGAGISSMASFFAMWIIRLKDTKKIIEVSTDWSLITGNLAIIFLQIFLLKLNFKTPIEIIFGICLFIIILIRNKKLVRLLINLVIKAKVAIFSSKY